MAERKNRPKWTIALGVFLILIAFVIFSGVYLKTHYKDIVKNVIKNEIGKRVETDVYTNVDFTVFKTFPYATVIFKNATINDPLRKDSILLEAETIYFKFNVLDVIRGNYNLKKIDIQNADLNLFVNEKGEKNYSIFKETPDTVETAFSLELKKVGFKNVALSYYDQGSENELNIFCKEANAKGKFNREKYELAIFGDFNLDNYSLGNTQWLRKEPLRADLVLMVNSEKEKFSVTRGEIEINALPLTVNGKILYGEAREVNLRLKSPAVDLETILEDLPRKFTKKLKGYKIRGKPYVNITIAGEYGKGKNPGISADFGMKKAFVEHKKSEIKLENIAFQGSFSNGEQNNAATSKIELNNIHGVFDGQKLIGNLEVRDLKKPGVRLKVITKFDLNRIKQFLKLDTLQKAKGKIDLNLKFAFRPKDLDNIKPRDLVYCKMDGNLGLSNVDIQFKDSKNHFSKLNGELSFNNKDVVIKGMEGLINETNDFSIHGYMDNFLPFIFFKDEKLHLTADWHSRYLSFDDLLNSDHQSKSENKDSYEFSLPENITFQLDADVDKLKFRRFKGENISGIVRLEGQSVQLINLNMNSMGGNIRAKGNLRFNDKQKIIIQGKTYFNKVEIKQAFYQLENFGQEALTHKNISGKLTSDFTFDATFSKALKPVQNSLTATADLIVKDGKLVNYKPLKDLSKFVKVKDLSNIAFGTLKNTISVKEETIIIPDMEIKSSAVDIKLSGKHTLQNKIDYHLEILLSDLLSRKARKNKKENSRFGRIKDDGLHQTTLFLKVSGTTENPQFSYDTEGLKEKLKKDMQEEKSELKQIMHEELGLYRGDSTVDQKPKTERQIKREKKRKEREKRKKQLEEREKGKFIIEWEEE